MFSSPIFERSWQELSTEEKEWVKSAMGKTRVPLSIAFKTFPKDLRTIVDYSKFPVVPNTTRYPFHETAVLASENPIILSSNNVGNLFNVFRNESFGYAEFRFSNTQVPPVGSKWDIQILLSRFSIQFISDRMNLKCRVSINQERVYDAGSNALKFESGIVCNIVVTRVDEGYIFTGNADKVTIMGEIPQDQVIESSSSCCAVC